MSLFPTPDKPIGLASDHAGFSLKEYIITLFKSEDIPYIDFGTYSTDSVDYPDFGHKLGEAIDSGQCDKGIAVCGSGNGINMTLNHHKYVRSALCWNTEITRLARLHNDANVLTLPGRFINQKEAYDMIEVFFNTLFEGGRHQNRIDKIPC
ncbi:RpiB/LacA/LacB family sugar-phosphate isomerase [Prevotella sp. 10(H)]|uniref:RpiB/LacA/LacB family sugar-phosphate isomerase n=1 Tax=Prevotella sp. 10(H) TaxID=1158294 RepID=UPI0004A756EF|nr:RpiB/LacA/LacB family sugar-phosphate isomerase [Prevotella sp. 10(H)]